MTNHTPTPWRDQLHFAKKQGGRSYAFITTTRDLVPVAAVTLGAEGCSEVEGRANIAFIVRAVNNHDALVKLIERFSNSWVIERSGWNYSELDFALKEARGLLASVSSQKDSGK